MKQDIKSLYPEEIEEALKNMGEKPFRASQIFSWFSKGITSFDDITNISKELKEKLKENFDLFHPEVITKQESQIDGTIKYLWRLHDGNSIESVVMSYSYGNTICVSSQVGCRMGCKFCASTIGGKIRDLNASEILDQVIFAEKDSGKKISHIVLMGIGEPLDNFDNVMRFLKLVNSPKGLNIGMRHISLSTCGLTEKIDKLGSFNLQLTLTVSLHGPDDLTRSQIMPINNMYGVEKVCEACKRYFDTTGRRISFEYAMIDGVNDTENHAYELAKIARELGAHINLIPLNNVEGSPLKPSTPENLKKFVDILQDKRINVTIRRRLGSDIDASCGQLRRKETKNKLKS